MLVCVSFVQTCTRDPGAACTRLSLRPLFGGAAEISGIARARCARALLEISAAPPNRGRRESRMHAAPAVPWANCTNKTPTSIQVQRRQSDFPCAMVLTVASCSSRRSGFFVTVALRVFSQDLTPASRRQNHTTWPSAPQHLRPRRCFASTASPPRVCDDHDTPL